MMAGGLRRRLDALERRAGPPTLRTPQFTKEIEVTANHARAEFRLRCLEMALRNSRVDTPAADVVAAATALHDFVLGAERVLPKSAQTEYLGLDDPRGEPVGD